MWCSSSHIEDTCINTRLYLKITEANNTLLNGTEYFVRAKWRNLPQGPQ